ncbi:MAG: OmpA family protein, partial [Bacteroidota bacterium]
GNDQWGEPQNLGFPINGPDNDFHLVLTMDNRKAYYVSNDDSGYGRDDIYTLTAPRIQLNKLDKDGIQLTSPSDLIAINDPKNVEGKIPEPTFRTLVTFGFDRSGVSNNNQEVINQWIEYLKANESVRVEISGHTCNIGNFQYNQILSQRRARAVADYLIKQGIDANRIEVQGYSFSRPLPGNKNSTPAERAANRRTEFTIIEENKNE